MAEAVGFAASIIGIIQLTGQLAILTHGYIGGVKRASQDISSLLNELASFNKVLIALKDYLEAKPKSVALLGLGGPGGPILGCTRELEALQAKLVPKEGLEGFLDKLKWPLKESETQGYISQLERHKSLFSLALTIDNITLSKEIEAYTQTTSVLVRTETAEQRAWRNNDDTIKNKEERDLVLNWLSPKDFERKIEDKHLETSKVRHPATGKWLLMAPAFRDLAKKNPDGSLLWGFGIPGAGKTFLSSVAIDYFLEEGVTKNYGVAYIYFEYKERELQTPMKILSSLTRQLAAQIVELPAAIKKLHDKLESGGKRPKFEELYSAFAATYEPFDQVFLIFDALDECDQRSQRKELLPLFHRMRESGASLFVTSRQYPEDIQESFCDAAKIDLSPKEEDIGAYIQQRIDEDARARRLVRQAKCQDRVISELIQSSKGMFLLAHYNIEYICQQPTAKKVLVALDKIKSSSTTDRPLDPTYDRAMETLRGQNEDCIDLGLLVLSWLVKANRTLTVEEIRVAVAIELDTYELDELDLPDKTTILDVCAGLVIIDETSDTMKLAHYTVQEYLLSNSIIPDNACFTLAMACTTFLTFDVFSDGACVSDSSVKVRFDQQPFLRYAVSQLPSHLKACDEELTTDAVLKFISSSGNVISYLQVLYYGDDEDNSNEDSDQDCEEEEDSEDSDSDSDSDSGSSEEGSGSGSSEEDSEDEDQNSSTNFNNYPKDHSPLHVACELGHLTVFKLLLENETVVSLEARNSYEQTPLHIAAEEGHEGIVALLLKNGANPSATDDDDLTPLHNAACEGKEEVVRLLLEYGADISIQDNTKETALFQAAREGRVEVLRLLLEKGADLSIADDVGETPLHVATSGGHREAFRLLLEHGADLSVLDNEGQNVLHEAALGGDEQLVQVLLERGVDAHVLDNQGRSALFVAAEAGHFGVVQLLLDKGANLSVPDKKGSMPLIVAAGQGDIELVRLLLERGGDISSTNEYGYTALHQASLLGNEPVVKLLLEKGADASFCDATGSTALHRAARKGHNGIVRLLLDHGASLSLRDENGFTPLYVASVSSDSQLVELLLERGADISSTTNKFGYTALHQASYWGNEPVVKLLLEKGADISFRDAAGSTSLHKAASKGHNEIVRLLLDHGASHKIEDNEGNSPLLDASWSSDPHLSELLLERGADISTTNKSGYTALHLASFYGNELVAKLLIEKGADVSFCDPMGSTALHRAARRGHNGIVRLLLEHGASPAIEDEDGDRPLYEACGSSDPQLVELLLQQGADISTVNKLGYTALHQASFCGNEPVVKLLLEKGVDVSFRDAVGSTALHRASRKGFKEIGRLLLDHGASLSIEDEEGDRPLYEACGKLKCDPQFIELLLQRGADISASNKLGFTALHQASYYGNESVVKLLLEKGADASFRNTNGITALQNAVFKGHKEIARLLLDHGANPSDQDSRGDTALHFATRNSNPELVQLLLDSGVDTSLKSQGMTAVDIAMSKENSTVLALFDSSRVEIVDK